MNFDVDRQTLNDLAIFQNHTSRQSVCGIFSHTNTIGGNEILQEIFTKPLIDAAEIKERIAVFNFIEKSGTKISMDKNSYDFVDFYLKSTYKKRLFPFATGLIENLIYAINNNNSYYIIQRGIESTLNVVNNLLNYAETLVGDLPKKIEEFRATILTAFEVNEVLWLKRLEKKPKLNASDIAEADRFFRSVAHQRLIVLLNIAYQLDVYQTVGSVANARGLTNPVISETGETELVIEGLFHPFIPNPKSNDVAFSPTKNLSFITGTNMAGKSSLLKSIGIAIYLSQLGFPVPAKNMVTSVFNGLITTVNLADDIEQGHSHFYKEVLRVKQVAEKLNQSKHIFVIFDELFRGTNVKDAFDASFAIISAFADVKTSFFVISTHIVEVAHQLSATENIQFRYMETTFTAECPVNTYKLKDGITDERLGMWIVKNEGIIDIIKNASKD